MPQPRCTRRALSLGQRVLCDYLHFSNRVRRANAERTMRLADVVEARRLASPRPSWAAILTKAFALAASNHPRLRSAFFSFPWGHVGEFDYQIGSVVLNRRVGDDDVLLLAPLVRPEDQPLAELDARLRAYQHDPVETIRPFRDGLRVARLPGFLRRFLWWLALDVVPPRRAKHFGTFGVTSMSPYGAKSLEVPGLWTALLHYGTVGPDGDVPVGISFDHRVVGGTTVGYALVEMEQALHHAVVAELRAMRPARAA